MLPANRLELASGPMGCGGLSPAVCPWLRGLCVIACKACGSIRSARCRSSLAALIDLQHGRGKRRPRRPLVDTLSRLRFRQWLEPRPRQAFLRPTKQEHRPCISSKRSSGPRGWKRSKKNYCSSDWPISSSPKSTATMPRPAKPIAIAASSTWFRFLSWTFRRYPSGKLLIKPSKAAIRKHRRRLASEMRRLRGSNARAVIASLNPVIRGWAAYHRGMVSSEVFNSLGAYMWKLTWKWARHSHTEQAGKLGSRPGTSARSTRSGKTRGCSATGKPAATCASTAGRGYAATSWSRAGHPPTTRTWQATRRYRRDKHGTPLDIGAMNLLRAGNGAAARCAGTGS